MTDVDRLVSLIGQASDSADVKAWLAELKATAPHLKEGDVQAWVAARSAGLDLVFTDEAHRSKRNDLAVGEGALILDAIMFMSSQVPDYAEYQGPLPNGVVFGEPPARVHQKLGTPERLHDRMPKEFWTFRGLQLTITYDKPKTKVRSVSLATPLQQ
ncbi:MAG TPA: hypothetical protein VKU41_32850 [Polyangiaceae bacterium]|nr:hypothetical protein [Polyangiaceae bacterium]